MAIFQISPPKIKLVKIPAGDFIMGIDSNGSPESPEHKIHLADYYIGKYPITNVQYLHFVKDTGHSLPNTWTNNKFPEKRADHPVGGITWADAELFCAWLRYKTGKPFHLPTEAQWEKAATWNPLNNQKTHFPWGNEFLPNRCNLLGADKKQDSSPFLEHGLIVHSTIINLHMHIANDEIGTTPIGYYSPLGDSSYGCADMTGNVEEWCNSAMRDYPYQAYDGREEKFTLGQKCIRGGDWFTGIQQSGIRRSTPSDAWLPLWGFRIALSHEIRHATRNFRENTSKKIEQNREKFKLMSQSKPNSIEVYYDWGTFLLPLLNYRISEFVTEAKQAFSQAIAIYEKLSSGLFARLSNRRLTESPPVNYLYYNRALVLGELKDFTGAYADMSKAIKLDKTDADAYMMRADYAFRLKKYRQAEQDLLKAHKLDTKSTFRKQMLEARLLESKEKWEEAYRAYSDLINHYLFAPLPYPEIYLWRANVLRKLGFQGKAMSDYYHYFLLNPKNKRVAAIIEKAQQRNKKTDN